MYISPCTSSCLWIFICTNSPMCTPCAFTCTRDEHECLSCKAQTEVHLVMCVLITTMPLCIYVYDPVRENVSMYMFQTHVLTYERISIFRVCVNVSMSLCLCISVKTHTCDCIWVGMCAHMWLHEFGYACLYFCIYIWGCLRMSELYDPPKVSMYFWMSVCICDFTTLRLWISKHFVYISMCFSGSVQVCSI